MKHRISLIVLVAAVLALFSCAGGKSVVDSSPAGDGPRDTAGLAAALPAFLPDGTLNQEYLDADWAAWLADPGEPGVDYDPALINVSYSPAALGFRSPSAVHLPEGMSAAEQPNSILRSIPGYETITDSIAASQPVTIDTQVYYGDVTFAAFRVNEDADAAKVLEDIRSDYAPYIEYAAYAMLLHAEFKPNDQYVQNSSGLLWSLYRIDALGAWDYTMGDSDEWMADVDTGILMSHQELTGQVLDPLDLLGGLPGDTEFDLANGDNTIEDISNSGHGTFIAGIMGARGNDNLPMVGIAYQSRIVPVKISNGDSASDTRIAAGSLLGFAAGARAVNLSWGAYHHNPELQAMVNTIYNGGGILFGAAGNDNTDDLHFPSDYQNAISVGSTDPTNRRAWFSNYGTAIDIAAPGIPLVSTGHHSDDDYHDNYLGTSFSCPMVAAAATLLWSYKPDLTNDEVRNILLSTGAPIVKYTDTTPNFPDLNPPILRLDIAAALAEVDAVRVNAPKPEAVIQQGVISLTPDIKGEPDSVDCLFNGNLVGTLTSAPWTFDIDTTSVSFGRTTAKFIAHKAGDDDSSADIALVVDNTAGNFPVVEDFEAGKTDFVGLDLKGYSLDVLKAAKDIPGPGQYWTADDVASHGLAQWKKDPLTGYQGSGSMALEDSDAYGGYELDALISRRVKLTGVSNPSVVFYHHYNLEDGGQDYDRAWVYVTPDYGATMLPAKLKSGGDAYFSGYLADWTKAEIDLSGFSGLVHVVLLMETDGLKAGENGSAPAGWWVDMITVSSNYNENVPTLTGVSVNDYSLYGVIPGLDEIDIAVEEAQNVATVRYVLDVVPYGDIGADDKIIDVTEPFVGVITGLDGLQNQLANLHVRYYDTGGLPGQEIIVPLYIFNLLGDVNADNMVDAADTAAYTGMVGLTSADPAYNPLFDSDLDGVITESDASAVGYFWGSSI